MPKHLHFGHSRKILVLEKNSGSLGICMLPSHLGHLIKAEFFLGFCPSLWVLSHICERESMLARTILEALVNMRGEYFI
jgi:hypothetical protein